MSDYFVNSDVRSCPIKNCKIKDETCKNSFSFASASIAEGNLLELKTNQISGAKENFCVECTNGYKVEISTGF